MGMTALIGSVGGLGSALIGSSASKSASNAQVQLGQQALALQQQLGQQGINALLGMFNTAQGIAQPFAQNLTNLGQGALNVGYGVLGQGTNALNQGAGLIGQGAGIAGGAADTLKSLLTPGANMTATLSQIPGFQFAQDWGQQAVANEGTKLGLGGNTLTAGANYATGLAQQGYGNIVNALQGLMNGGTSLANLGVASGTALGNLGSNVLSTGQGLLGTAGNTVGSLISGATNAGSSAFGGLNQLGANVGGTLGNIGNSTAAGILGSANAMSNGLQNVTGSLGNAYLLNGLLNRGANGIYGQPDVNSSSVQYNNGNG